MLFLCQSKEICNHLVYAFNTQIVWLTREPLRSLTSLEVFGLWGTLSHRASWHPSEERRFAKEYFSSVMAVTTGSTRLANIIVRNNNDKDMDQNDFTVKYNDNASIIYRLQFLLKIANIIMLVLYVDMVFC